MEVKRVCEILNINLIVTGILLTIKLYNLKLYKNTLTINSPQWPPPVTGDGSLDGSSHFMMCTYSFLFLILHYNVTDPLLLLKQNCNVTGHIYTCLYACVCACVRYHLAGRPGREIVHHLVHLSKPPGHGLHLSMQLLVLGVLVVEHSLVLVPLLLWADSGVLPVGDNICFCLIQSKLT